MLCRGTQYLLKSIRLLSVSHICHLGMNLHTIISVCLIVFYSPYLAAISKSLTVKLPSFSLSKRKKKTMVFYGLCIKAIVDSSHKVVWKWNLEPLKSMSKFRLVLKVKEPSKDSQYRLKSLGLWRTLSLVSYRNRAYRPSHLTPISALPCPVVPGQWTPVTRSDRAVVLCNTLNLKLFVKRKWLRREVCLSKLNWDLIICFLLLNMTAFCTEAHHWKRDAFWMHVEIAENLHSI